MVFVQLFGSHESNIEDLIKKKTYFLFKPAEELGIIPLIYPELQGGGTHVGVCCVGSGGDGGGGWAERRRERESEREGTGEGFVYFCCVILRLLRARWERKRKKKRSEGEDGGLLVSMSGG